MTDTSARSRQSAGQPTGGQFATEARGTDTGVSLGEFLSEERGERVPVGELRVGDTIWEPWTGEQQVSEIIEVPSTGETLVYTGDGGGARVHGWGSFVNRVDPDPDVRSLSAAYTGDEDHPDISAELGEVGELSKFDVYATHDMAYARGEDWCPVNVDPVTGAVDGLRVDEDGFARPVMSRSPREDAEVIAKDARWLCTDAGVSGWEAALLDGKRTVSAHQVESVLSHRFATHDGQSRFNDYDPYVPGTREDMAAVLHHARRGDVERTEAAMHRFVDRQAREGWMAQPVTDGSYVPPQAGSRTSGADAPTSLGEVAKAARADLDEAVRAGYLPGLDYSVSSDADGVQIGVSGVSRGWVEGPDGYYADRPADNPSVRELRRRAGAVLDQYNWGEQWGGRRFMPGVVVSADRALRGGS